MHTIAFFLGSMRHHKKTLTDYAQIVRWKKAVLGIKAGKKMQATRKWRLRHLNLLQALIPVVHGNVLDLILGVGAFVGIFFLGRSITWHRRPPLELRGEGDGIAQAAAHAGGGRGRGHGAVAAAAAVAAAGGVRAAACAAAAAVGAEVEAGACEEEGKQERRERKGGTKNTKRTPGIPLGLKTRLVKNQLCNHRYMVLVATGLD